jgi:hypothetical protein
LGQVCHRTPTASQVRSTAIARSVIRRNGSVSRDPRRVTSAAEPYAGVPAESSS